MGDTDIRRWFLKQPHKKEAGESLKEKDTQTSASPDSRPDLKKTSKYFSGPRARPAGSDGDANNPSPEGKRKQQSSVSKPKESSSPSPKKARIEQTPARIEPKASASLARIKTPDDDDELEGVAQTPLSVTPGKGRGGRGRGIGGSALSSSSHEQTKAAPGGRGRGGAGGKGGAASLARAKTPDDDDDDEELEGVAHTPSSGTSGRGRGGRGRGRGGSAISPSSHDESKAAPAGRGRGGGGGRGGAAFYQPRQTPPHKGEKEVPEGADDCLAGSTFVISGTLDSLEREEAEDLIKRHGGRVTGSISKKTSYLLADEDVGGRKSQKAKELGVPFLTEDGLFDIIRSSKPSKSSPVKQREPVSSSQVVPTQKGQAAKVSPAKLVHSKPLSEKPASSSITGVKPRVVVETEAWPQKYSPKGISDMIGNQSVVKQLHDWLQQWFGQNLQGNQQKGKKHVGDSGSAKRAVLLSGPPGIGKTTSARLICKLLDFEAFEVNASDNRGKADPKVGKGVSGSTANAIKEMVSNEAITLGQSDKHKKAVLIMDEVDGMSGGDRGGVADLITSIKITKIPIICICNDRYSQKLKSLINHCLPLNFRKPTKQQMAKRLLQVAQAEGMQVDEIALEELAERVNGDMRMALNELQYMSLRTRVIKFNDVKARLGSNAKDEDMSPFTAVDRLMSYDGGRLRMDQRLDASMSDPDLVPLLIQENYLNYCPALAGRDDNGIARMDLIARSAACIADGDIVSVQIRQYRQWQHSQMAAFMSSIIPAALMHGRREILTQGERNFNRFGGWLGKNSSYGKKLRLLDDIHVHLLASRLCEPTRQAVRRDYLHVLALHLTAPLKSMPKEMAVKAVVDFMEEYSLTQEDVDSVLDLLKFQGQTDLMVGVQPAVKAALTKAYKQRDNERRVRSSDLLPVFSLSGQKKQPKKRGKLQILPPELELDEVAEEDEESADSEDDETDDTPVAFKANGNVKFNLDKGTSTKAGNQGKGSVAAKRSAPKEVNNKQPAKRRKA